MPIRKHNSLLLCFVILALNGLAISYQLVSSDDWTTTSGLHSAPASLVGKPKFSRNDPFRVFVPPSDPVCCLIPLPSIQPDPHPTDDLLPFEEWKQRQLALSSPQVQQAETESAMTTVPDGLTSLPETTNSILVPKADTNDAPSVPPFGDFVPIQGRFNYASLDCSARVHSSHKSMKSASSVLSSKKDRYMLAPCSAQNKHIVIELCDEIRVDTVQLANLEFFSGVFKDIAITLSPTAHFDGPGSEIMGLYEARNVRSVQTFRSFNRPHAFTRFIRVEFRTHYGKEYFCPVSLLRVYGLTQMEEWRMEEWERDWRARQYPTVSAIAVEPTQVSATSVLPAEAVDNTQTESDERAQIRENYDQSTQAASTSVSSVLAAPEPTDEPSMTRDSETPETSDTTTQSRSIASHDDYYPPASSLPSPSDATRHSLSSPNITGVQKPLTPDAHTQSSAKVSKTKAPSSASTGTPVLKPSYAASPSPSNPGGESIYRTIMNRLDVLERNSTLSLRYVEEQNYSIRQALRRLEEEVGRLKALTGRQQHELQRSVKSVEKKQAEMEKRWDALLEQVATLAEEVVLEKRLGIAQLCLLTTVLVFMALTRGSRVETHMLSGWRRRMDSGVIHPRTRVSSRPTLGDATFARVRQDWHSTEDVLHRESDPRGRLLTAMRPSSPPQSTGTLSGLRVRSTSGNETRSPTRQSSRGVRFPPKLHSLTSPQTSRTLTGMRRSLSLSLSTDQLVLLPGTGRRPATGTKRLARTAHLHDIEVEGRRRDRIQASPTGDKNATSEKPYAVAGGLLLPGDSGLSRTDDRLDGDGLAPHYAEPPHQESVNTGMLDQRYSQQDSEKDGTTEWEDTDAETEADPSQEPIVEHTPAPYVPKLSCPPNPVTWEARRGARGSVDAETTLKLQCAG